MNLASTELNGHVSAWFTGWSALHSYPTAVTDTTWMALRMDRGGEKAFFIAEPTPTAFALAAAEVMAARSASLSVVGTDVHGYVKMAHAAGLGFVSSAEHLMACAMDTQDSQDPYLTDPDMELIVKRLGGRRSITAGIPRYFGSISNGPSMLASGSVAICGEHAVFDSLQTPASLRRRGFGLQLMQALSAQAMAHPVTTGVALSSIDGQRMLGKLGWRSLGAVSVLVPRERLAELAMAQ